MKQRIILGLKILSAIALLVVTFEVLVYFNSAVVIVPASPKDSQNRFSQPFVLINNGYFDAIDIGIWMDLANVVDLAQNFYGSDSLLTQEVKRVNANQSVTVDIAYFLQWLKEPIQRADIDIEILYRPSYFPFRKARAKFKYYVERKNDGTIYWRHR